MSMELAVIQSYPILREFAVARTQELADQLNKKFGFFGPDCRLIGSCEIQGQGNDIDVMITVFAPHHTEPLVNYLKSTGFIEQEVEGADDYGPGDFRSLRKGDVNALIVWSTEVARKWIAAVEVCKYVKTQNRTQRVAIHKIIMDGEDATDQEAEEL